MLRLGPRTSVPRGIDSSLMLSDIDRSRVNRRQIAVVTECEKLTMTVEREALEPSDVSRFESPTLPYFLVLVLIVFLCFALNILLV